MVLLTVLSLSGCADMQVFLAESLPYPGYPADKIERNDFTVAKEEDVVGRMATIRLQKEDTLPDIARHFSLGINTLSAANPGIDIWVPEAGERILLPMSYILPDAKRKGIVINLAAMRLFYFKENGNRLAVSTYPVGVGTEDRPTPMGKMYVRSKKLRPTWYVPASIAADHRKKGDPLPSRVPPGPENPLGEHALYLSRSSYLIHGTNKPASVGLRATNGCIRLYPEDIESLFEDTPVKTPVHIVNQPYLVGRRDGIIYLEAHKPFEESGTQSLKKLFAKLKQMDKESGYILDWKRVENVVAEARGLTM
jgi:L,D-transpeptidase ErfK/SrfK